MNWFKIITVVFLTTSLFIHQCKAYANYDRENIQKAIYHQLFSFEFLVMIMVLSFK